MTVAEIPQPIFLTGDGITTVFPFDYYLLDASHLTVIVVMGATATTQTLGVHYTVAGVGNMAGGTVTFVASAIPGDGSTVALIRNMPYEQPTSFQTVGYIDLPAIERAIDRQHMLITQLLEELGRRPALAQTVLPALRNLAIPTPEALGLWQWNATATALTYGLPAIVQVTPDAVSGLAYTKHSATVLASSGATTDTLTATALVPAGCLLLGVTARVSVTCGQTGGLTTWSLGEASLLDRWGGGITHTAGTLTTAGQWGTPPQQIPIVNALSVRLTADGGVWDGTGAIIVTAHCATFTPDT